MLDISEASDLDFGPSRSLVSWCGLFGSFLSAALCDFARHGYRSGLEQQPDGASSLATTSVRHRGLKVFGSPGMERLCLGSWRGGMPRNESGYLTCGSRKKIENPLEFPLKWRRAREDC